MNTCRLTDPSLFICNHYPDEKQWLLVKDAPSLDDFYRSTFKSDGFIKNKLNHYAPSTYFVRMKRGDKFQLRFTSNSDNIDQQARLVITSTKKLHLQREVLLYKNYVGEFVLEDSFIDKGTFQVTVFINGFDTFVYQVIVQGFWNGSKKMRL